MCEVRLRGNTFLVLLFRAGNSNLSANSEYGSKKNVVTKPALFADLLGLISPAEKPDLNATFRGYLSEYLYGVRPSSKKYYNFASADYRDQFALQMNNAYQIEVKKMLEICETYLAVTEEIKMQRLVGGIIDSMNQDETIDSEYSFFTGYESLSKRELSSCSHINLPAFLLSVWFYIATEQWNTAEAADTYKKWTETINGQKERDVVTDIGNEWTGKIEVDYVPVGIKKAAQPHVAAEPISDNNMNDLFSNQSKSDSINETEFTEPHYGAQDKAESEWQKSSTEDSNNAASTNQTLNVYNNTGNGTQNNISGNVTFNLNFGGDKHD